MDLDKVLGINYEKEVDFVKIDTMDPEMEQQYRGQLLDQIEEIKKTIDSFKS